MSHPQIERYIEQFEAQAKLQGRYRGKIGKAEHAFLENVWWPAFQYNFNGLIPEYPLRDCKGGQRFVDFVYTREGMRIIIEIDGYTTHARDISSGDFDDHLMRQNDLVLSGWMILRFSAAQVEKKPMICRRQLKQAIGHWWAITHNDFSEETSEIWAVRKNIITRLALQREGKIRAKEVAEHFAAQPRTVLKWLYKFANEGYLKPVQGKKRIIGFALQGYAANHEQVNE